MSKLKPERPRIAIIDFGMGNLFSVKQACEHVGLHAVITNKKEDVLSANGVILPGVGAFGTAMAHLRALDLVSPIRDCVRGNKPVLGICLGMQLLMSQSEEFGIHEGLNVIKGPVVRFHDRTETGKLVKVPQVGWNKIMMPKGVGPRFWAQTPLEGLDSGAYMYFVHSFYVKPENPGVILSVSQYGNLDYCSALRSGSVFATQFHPEKSAQKGLAIYERWTSLVVKHFTVSIQKNSQYIGVN